ncbi:hypothetical protein HHI36_016001 [Cryptolaemus montrouzieri]|uniref:Trichohyalin-plectin-homology domain-containing protein n=1 Tax=Cryptolaemus montrouzieri TaxID=559131 RepID=A0ABD2N7Y4_9CUCU
MNVDTNKEMKHKDEILELSKERYENMIRQLNQKQIREDKMKQEKEHRRHLKQMSTKMAEEWPDSLMNIGKRKDDNKEIRKQQLSQLMEKEMKYFEEFERQNRLQNVNESKRKALIQYTPTLALSKALVETHVLAENEAIVKMKEKLRLQELAKEKKWSDLVYEDVKLFNKEQEQKQCRIREKSKLYQRFQLEQIKGKSDRNSTEKRKQLKEECEDLARLQEEIKERKEIEIERSRSYSENMNKMLEHNRKKNQKRKYILEAENRELSNVCSLFNETYQKRRTGITQQYKQEIKEVSDARSKSAIIYRQKIKPIEEQENINYINYTEKQEKLYLKEQKLNEDRRQQQIKDKLDDLELRRQKLQQKEEIEHSIFLFDTAERLKAAEELRKYEDEKRKINRKKAIEFSEEWKKQIAEKQEIKSKEATKILTVDLNAIQDEKFFSYAKEILDQVRSSGRNDYTIRREIKKYCVQNNLPLDNSYFETSSHTGSSSVRLPVKLPAI